MADWQLEGVWLRENFGEVLWTPKIVQWRYSRETFSFSASFISFWGFFFSSPPTIKHFIHNVVPYQQFPFMVCLLMRSQAADKLDKKENEINSYWFLGKRKKKVSLASSFFFVHEKGTWGGQVLLKKSLVINSIANEVTLFVKKGFWSVILVEAVWWIFGGGSNEFSQFAPRNFWKCLLTCQR